VATLVGIGNNLKSSEIFRDSTVEPLPKEYLIGNGAGRCEIPSGQLISSFLNMQGFNKVYD
jgi:hypothetical protein